MTTSITVNTLRLKGHVEDQRGLVTTLQAADWPVVPDRRWVFVHSLRIRATEAAIRTRLDEALTRILATNPAADEMVRFDDHGQLLARLSLDLAQGRAAGHWYWQHWSSLLRLPRDQALARLWRDHIDELPTILAQLRATAGLGGLWRLLSPPQALELCRALSWHAGLALTPALTTATAGAVPDLPATEIQAWREVLSGLPPTDPRCWLAAAVLVLEWRPLALRPTPAPVLQALVRTLVHGSDRPTANPQAPGAGDALMTPAPSINAPSIAGPAAAKAGPGIGAAKPAPPPGPTSAGEAPGANAASAHAIPPAGADRPIPTTVGTPAEGLDRSAGQSSLGRLPATGTEPSTGSGCDSFRSRQGGVFFIVNALNRAEVQDWLEQRGGMQRQPQGWLWLYRLGMGLGLDDADPVVDFFAARIGCGSTTELADQPALPDEALLQERLLDLYSPQVWGAQLLAAPAAVIHTPSHLDITLPMSAVRLDQRRTGLDLDPGWVPWLGRVMRFHFESPTGAGDRPS